MKKFFFILIIIFICGVLSADICVKQIQESVVIVGADFYEQYANAKLVFKDVFWNVLYERIKLFGILVLLCFTPLKEKVGIVFALMFSFIWGFFAMCSIAALGGAGIVVGLACVLPHGIFYGIMIWAILGRRRAHGYYSRNNIAISGFMCIILILFFVTGCVIESVVGTHFLPWVIRLSLV